MIALSPAQTLRVETELGELAVHVVGTGEPVVAWHSMFVDSRSWGRLLPLLPDRRFYLIDAPSYGASDRLARATDNTACTRAAAQVLGGIAELDAAPVDWMGNAWGGHIGIELAATRPDLVRSLVSISAPTFPISASLRVKIHLLLPIFHTFGARGPVRSTILETLLTDDTRRADPEVVALLDACLTEVGTAAIDAMRTCILNRTDLLWAARQLSCPTVFVTTDDRGEWTSTQARVVVDQMPTATEATITGARVIPALEQPEQLATVVREFWAGLR